tara:strand:+ start:3374 stop:3667 length:294 start_codon:yes stop_codon:yes gene_type:complete
MEKAFFTLISNKKFQNLIFLVFLFITSYGITNSQQENNWLTPTQLVSEALRITLFTFIMYRIIKLILPNHKILAKVFIILLWSFYMFFQQDLIRFYF